jgi:sugar phosphate isomerase/epimerase
MRLGAPVFLKGTELNPENYLLEHVKKGYSAAYCPEGLTAGDTDLIKAYRKEAEKQDVLFAEVGAWCNLLTLDETLRKKNLEYTIERLALAEELGAKTCVNIIGTRCEENWFGPDAENYSEDFLGEAVDTARRIVDAVKPQRAKLSFEMMPYSFLDSPEEYLRFLKAVDRKEIGVHFDPVNCINSPRLYYRSGAFLQEAFRLLGDRIVSIHLKDIRIDHTLVSAAFYEVPIGQGGMDYTVLLREAAKLPEQTPLMLEHLAEEQEYDLAAEQVRITAGKVGAAFWNRK